MPLEDEFCDIVKKARHGKGFTTESFARATNLSEHEIHDLERGSRRPRKDEVIAIASTLNVRGEPLADIAADRWTPHPSPSWMTDTNLVRTIVGDIGGYEVKGYLLTDPHTKHTMMIDTGYNAPHMIDAISKHALKLQAICLTHGHDDHAGGLETILESYPATVYLGANDLDLLTWTPPNSVLAHPTDGKTIDIGELTVTCIATPGHTPGGYCYSLQTGSHSLCFVGDTLFAGSVGRSCPFSLYATHLTSVRQRVLTQSEDTVLLPGHGPATTVGEERQHNPFA